MASPFARRAPTRRNEPGSGLFSPRNEGDAAMRIGISLGGIILLLLIVWLLFYR
jgi:hypothetical protein